MKNLSFLIALLVLTNCSTYSKYASNTVIGKENGYVTVYNDAANFKSLTFGDIKFASNRNEFRALADKRPAYKSILFYGKTFDPEYEYYVLINPKKKYAETSHYLVKDTTIATNTFVIIISKNAPQKDIQFITESIFLLH